MPPKASTVAAVAASTSAIADTSTVGVMTVPRPLQLPRGPRGLVRVEVPERDPCARGEQPFRNRATEPLGRPGDHRPPSVEIELFTLRSLLELQPSPLHARRLQ